MIVTLVREAHADAGNLRAGEPSRHLTAYGRRAARAIGQRLRWHDCTPTAIWASPLAPAVMTAELIAQAIEFDGTIECLAGLSAPGGSVELVAMIEAVDPSGSVLIVGDGPVLSAIGGRLCQRDDMPQLRFAQAVRIDHGELRWLFAHDADAPTRWEPGGE